MLTTFWNWLKGLGGNKIADLVEEHADKVLDIGVDVAAAQVTRFASGKFGENGRQVGEGIEAAMKFLTEAAQALTTAQDGVIDEETKKELRALKDKASFEFNEAFDAIANEIGLY